MTKIKLKPCPFCGGKATLVYDGDKTWQVICDDCGSCSDFYYEEWSPDNPPEGTIKAWNTRHIESKMKRDVVKKMMTNKLLKKRVKRLQEALAEIKEISSYMSASETTIYDLIGIYNVCCDALEGREE